MATVRLTVMLDVPEETIAEAIQALLAWPKDHTGPENMVYRLTNGQDNSTGYAYKESVGKAFLTAISHHQPEAIKDLARLEELSQYWRKYWCKFGGSFEKVVKDDVEPLREYVAIQLKYQIEQKYKDGWGQRLKEINEAVEALESASV